MGQDGGRALREQLIASSRGRALSGRFVLFFGGYAIYNSLALGHRRFRRGFLRKADGGEILSMETEISMKKKMWG